jgi:hypothetical protein
MFAKNFVILLILVFDLRGFVSQFYFGTTPSPSYNSYQYTTYNYQYPYYNQYNQYNPYYNQYNPYNNYTYPTGIITGSK